MAARTAILLNALALYALAAVLLMGFVLQVLWRELPCPLCLLQRVAFVALAVGPILNIRFGPRPRHYAMSLLAAVVGFGISLRQVMLHIMPGDPGYGTAILGLHYYSWAAIIFAAAIALIALVMLFERQFETMIAAQRPPAFAVAAVWLMIVITAANAAATFLECGFDVCPDNPVRYEMLQGAR